MLNFLTVYRFFSKQLCIRNLNLGGTKRSKLYQAVGKEGEIWREKRKERKQRRKCTPFDFLTEDFKLNAIAFFFYSLLFTTIFHSIKLSNIWSLLYSILLNLVCANLQNFSFVLVFLYFYTHKINAFFNLGTFRKEEHASFFFFF